MSPKLRAKSYQLALKATFQVPPEQIHEAILKTLKGLQKLESLQRAINKLLVVNDTVLRRTVFGVDFPRPLGLAAGFDKAAIAPDCWGPIGFGYTELGAVTAKPQPGNDRPRLFRLKEDRAILNHMGFNNPGAATVVENLRARRSDDVVGINIGKTKVIPLGEAADDYQESTSQLDGLTSYVVANVSSLNTPGLCDLQAVEFLCPILVAVTEEADSPVLVKITPDLSDDDVIAIADLAVDLGLVGIVTTNTTISRKGLRTPADEITEMGAGGVSGTPVVARSLEVLKLLHGRVGDKLVLISVGGIETTEQAWQRIANGASLLQGYTPLIYGGPDWIRGTHQGLARQIRVQGFYSISEAVGCGLPWRG